MNNTIFDMLSEAGYDVGRYYEGSILEKDNDIFHYGTKRHSGRYPWGSGDNPYQHSGDFYSRVNELKKEGFTQKEIIEAMFGQYNAEHPDDMIELSTTEFRMAYEVAKDEQRRYLVQQVKSLKSDGLSNVDIANKLNLPGESSVRSLLDADKERRMNECRDTANFLKEQVDSRGFIEVGLGTTDSIEKLSGLNISEDKLNTALYMLENEGYPVLGRGMAQVTNPGQQTILRVLCPPGTEQSDLYSKDFYSKLNTLDDYVSNDAGHSFHKIWEYPASISSDRIKVLLFDELSQDGYVSQERDGLIEIRRGVPDLDLGNDHYAQVRILVDGDKYLKGMAVYSDNIPEGYDIVFNSNKTTIEKAYKHTEDNLAKDPDNPFGSLLRQEQGQSYYIDPETGEEKLSAINKTKIEGDWGEWSKTLPSQFLSKQPQKLIDSQLDLTYEQKRAEFEEYLEYTNPTVRQKMLYSFADQCDADAVDLKAASLPRQQYQVILPVPQLKDDEIYAPNYDDGEKVALIRFPHEGTYQIPKLTVNNSVGEGAEAAKKLIGNTPIDAVCVSSATAEKLSGADFDGDTVIVIPTAGNGKNNKVNILSTPTLEGLKNFDTRLEYGTEARKEINPKTGEEETNYYREGHKVKIMTNTNQEMGKISNLITDMTLQNATEDEMARATRHAMTVIDAEKHKLDYKASYDDNKIEELKAKYQKHTNDDKYGGATTLLSKSGSVVYIPKTKGSPDMKIMKETGEKVYKIDTSKKYNKKGELVDKLEKSTLMATTKDAYDLVSVYNTPQERAYAKYANQMKAMALEARRIAANIVPIKKDPSASKAYEKEVESLNAKLINSEKNRPLERKAQILANSIISAKLQDNPALGTDKDKYKKVKQTTLTECRARVGASRNTIELTDSEWNAIQAGAISPSTLKRILNWTDDTQIKKLASPNTKVGLTNSQISLIKSYASSGYTTSQIATALGISTSSVVKYINE